MRCIYSIVLVLFVTSLGYAAPSKKAAAGFIREMQSTVGENQKVLRSGSTPVIHNHSQRVKGLQLSADSLFGADTACSMTASSAVSLWSRQLSQSQRPRPADAELIRHAQEDYQDNLVFCKKIVKELR